jgi:hypothetical protein
MLYIGDGETDVPCMKLVKDKGGTSIALYPPQTSKKRKQAEQLLIDKRVNFIAPAIYTDGARLDSIIKRKLEHIQSGLNLCKLSVMSSAVKKNCESQRPDEVTSGLTEQIEQDSKHIDEHSPNNSSKTIMQ